MLGSPLATHTMFGSDCHTADRDGVLVVERRRPRDAGVSGLPQTARRGRGVDHARVLLNDREVDRAGAGHGRTDVAPRHRGKRIGGSRRLGGNGGECERQQDSGLRHGHRLRQAKFLLCNNALGAWCMELEARGKGKMADTDKDLRANLLPGVTIVPAMVMAIEKAQAAGIRYNRQ